MQERNNYTLLDGGLSDSLTFAYESCFTAAIVRAVGSLYAFPTWAAVAS